MNNKIASILIIILTLLMTLATALVITEYTISFDIQLLYISIIFSVVTLFMLLFILFDIVIGRKLYIFKKDRIIVSRKGRVLAEIINKDINSPVLTKDAYSGKKQMLTFGYNGKKHLLLIRQDNEVALRQFISGINVKTRENTVQYLILYLLEIFCI